MAEEQNLDPWSQLSEGEREFVLRRLSKKSEKVEAESIPKRTDQGSALLSYSQEQLWFLDQFEPGVTAYVRPWVLRIRGPLNRQALELSLGEVVRRHEALRTIIHSSEGQAIQRVLPFKQYHLEFRDLSDDINNEQVAIQIAKEDAVTPFDLQKDPLFRTHLIRLADEEHFLLLTTHHIAFDGWSERVMFKEISQLYPALVKGKKAELPDPSVQYPDYAQWQRESLEGEKLDRLTKFWQNELAGAPPRLKLSTDFDRPKTRIYKGDSVRTLLPTSLSAAVHQFCREEGITLFMALLAVYKIILMKNSGEHDIVVGGTISGRNDLQLHDVIGFFVNTLVLRTDMGDDPTFKEVVERVRSTVLKALDNQDLPFEKLVEIINPPRDLSYTPIVQATLQLRNLPDRGPGIPGLEIEEVDIGEKEALFDLSLRVEELTEGLECILVFNDALFTKGTAAKLLDKFQKILQIAIAEPERKVSELLAQDEIDLETSKVREFISPILDFEIQEKSNLTGTQLLVWAGQKFRPDSLLYNLPYTFNIYGPIDVGIFKQAFHALIDCTDSLRTIITEEKGIPRRLLLDELSVSLTVHDFSSMPNPEVAVEEWLDTNSTKRFNFSEPLFESALLKVGEEFWVWFLHVHHIIVDNVGVQLLFERMEEIYAEIAGGSATTTRAYPQFSDHVEIEKNRLGTSQHQDAYAYWSKKLAKASEPLTFFGDRRLKETTHVERISVELDKDTCEDLFQLAESKDFFSHNQNVTLTNIFASLLFTFLFRTTNISELSLAMGVHNRRTPDEQSTIGLLMAMLPLRISIDDGETFTSLMNKVKLEASETVQHRHFAIGNPFHHPIYEVALNFQTVAVRTFMGSPVDMKRIHTGHEEDTVALQVRDYGSSGILTLDFDFHSDVFSKAEQDRAVSYFKRILTSVIDNPNLPLDHIELLSDRERARLLYEFNDTDKTYGIETTVINLFEKQVMESPDKVAVSHKGKSYTYLELNSRVNQVAHKLQTMGVGTGDPIGIFMERSLEMIVAIFGILKAGCAYLPLDPNHPKDRLKYLLSDSGVSTVLTKDLFLDRLPRKRLKTLTLDDWSSFELESEANPPLTAGLDDLAYVVYTSGSTGLPKGVMIEHHSLANFTEWAGESWEISPSDRVLQFTSISWDAHIEEIFPTLSRGATLVLRTEAMIETFQGFLETLDRENITVIDLPTAFWHEVTDSLETHSLRMPSSIRLVLIGGDQASPKRVTSWLENVGSRIRLVNSYGVTECTSISTQIDLSKNWSRKPSTTPIGKPIFNTRVYVLDKHNNPLPIGLPGVLWIGGEGLARGYINKPELNDEYFRPNPFSTTSSDRIYCSGDIGRFLPDGTLEMLGRIDNQVKIRGFRVELGEIEEVLGKHKAIKEVVVVARDLGVYRDPPRQEEKTLIAYFQTKRSNSLVDPYSEFRSFLRDKLPEYMIPTYFIEVDAFPLTIQGKIDNQALPLPEDDEIGQEKEYVPPGNSMEHQLVKIWEEVLGVPHIGVQDNFFDLGGHSLLAVRLFSQIENKIGIKLPLMTLFDAPTIANQARSIHLRREEPDPTWVVEVQSEGSKPPFFCVSPSVVNIITYRELSRNMGEDQPFYALYSEQMGLWREGKHQLETITHQFIERIQKIDPTGPYFIGGYSAGGIVALEISRELKKQGFEVGLLVLFDTFGPDYPKLRRGITPRIFNALLVIRRIQSYWWKFKLLDWKGRLQYLRLPRIHTWVRDRYGEVKTPAPIPPEGGAYYLTPARREYHPDDFDGNVLLVRAKRGLLGIHQDQHMGWKDVFVGNFDICMVPGDHEAMLFGPRSKFVARQINAYIESTFSPVSQE